MSFWSDETKVLDDANVRLRFANRTYQFPINHWYKPDQRELNLPSPLAVEGLRRSLTDEGSSAASLRRPLRSEDKLKVSRRADVRERVEQNPPDR